MARDKASIYIELQALYRDLYTFQYEMCKCDRIALGNKMLEHCEQAIAYFSLAYEVESQRVRYIEMLCAEFEVLKVECRFAVDRFYKKESTKNNIREHIAKIQEGIDKWWCFVFSARHE